MAHPKYQFQWKKPTAEIIQDYQKKLKDDDSEDANQVLVCAYKEGGVQHYSIMQIFKEKQYRVTIPQSIINQIQKENQLQKSEVKNMTPNSLVLSEDTQNLINGLLAPEIFKDALNNYKNLNPKDVPVIQSIEKRASELKKNPSASASDWEKLTKECNYHYRRHMCQKGLRILEAKIQEREKMHRSPWGGTLPNQVKDPKLDALKTLHQDITIALVSSNPDNLDKNLQTASKEWVKDHWKEVNKPGLFQTFVNKVLGLFGASQNFSKAAAHTDTANTADSVFKYIAPKSLEGTLKEMNEPFSKAPRRGR